LKLGISFEFGAKHSFIANSSLISKISVISLKFDIKVNKFDVERLEVSEFGASHSFSFEFQFHH
jgi:hypothetical protein